MAKAESKTILKAYSTVESKLPTLPLEDGQLIFVYDKKKIILDNHGVRTVYEQIQTIETEEQRNDLLAPIDSFYFVIETSILWRYTNGHWNQITTSPQEQIDRIVAEGAKQIKEVQDKGAEVLQSIPEDFATQMETKLNKQQGIENKGKALVIGEDGLVVPGEVQSGGDGIAIVNTASGESPLVIPDSAERVNKGFGLTGKTEQLNTRGVNLWRSDSTVIVSGTKYLMFDNPIQTGTYTLSAIFANDKSASESLFTFYNEQNQSMGGGAIKQGGRQSKTFTLTGKAVKVLFYASSGHDSSQGVTTTIKEIQLETGTTATPYEPYTGGKPSPSPEYPQEIKNSGKWNEETQKYEVDVKVVGKNLFDIEKAEASGGNLCTAKRENNIVKITAIETVTSKRAYAIVSGGGICLKAGKTYFLNGRKVGTSNMTPMFAFFKEKNIGELLKLNNFYTPNEDICIDIGIYLIGDAIASGDTLEITDIIVCEEKNVVPYQPYTEQNLTLTSDRPITKWDRLVEQGGQIGWLYSTGVYEDIKESDISANGINDQYGRYYVNAIKAYKNAECMCNIAEYSPAQKENKCGFWWNDTLCFLISSEYTGNNGTEDNSTAIKNFKDNVLSKGITVFYKLNTEEFIPLPQSEQNAIRALKTYYPTTVITVDGGELDPDIKVTYTADTKNYIDNKFGKTINAMQTKLLELESRV